MSIVQKVENTAYKQYLEYQPHFIKEKISVSNYPDVKNKNISTTWKEKKE